VVTLKTLIGAKFCRLVALQEQDWTPLISPHGYIIKVFIRQNWNVHRGLWVIEECEGYTWL